MVSSYHHCLNQLEVIMLIVHEGDSILVVRGSVECGRRTKTRLVLRMIQRRC